MTLPSRQDILVELGLTPTWRRRDADPAPASVVVAEPTDNVLATTLREPVPDALPGASTDSRLARIAALAWQDLAADVDACMACGLCRTRNKSVPGVGDPRAQWFFVGEAPGADEDARGEPFVGQAGRLLDNMLAALGLTRHRNVYIANVLKCRPPNNRTPEPGEADACRPYLERQIELAQPRLIVALGKSAASLLLGTDATIASLRGRVHRYRGVPLIVTYHPAYLLRSLPDKAKTWEDLLLARRTVVAEGEVAAASAAPAI
jgi:DNA polymerase